MGPCSHCGAPTTNFITVAEFFGQYRQAWMCAHFRGCEERQAAAPKLTPARP